MSTSTWNRSAKARRCSTFPTVWAAIHGCAGSGTSWRYTVGAFGRRRAEFACEACRAARDASDALVGPAYQAHLAAAQESAGVADYRTQAARWIDGRPQLVRSGEARSA